MTNPPAKPLPDITDLTRPFWQACHRHELVIQRCRACGRLIHYPKLYCPHDFTKEFDWVHVSGRGTVHSFVIAHRAFHPGFLQDVPYVIAIIALEEGPHMMSNILAPPETVKIDMPVMVYFEDINDEISLPKFKPAGDA
jgi:uncharacterized OB-fold protein